MDVMFINFVTVDVTVNLNMENFRFLVGKSAKTNFVTVRAHKLFLLVFNFYCFRLLANLFFAFFQGFTIIYLKNNNTGVRYNKDTSVFIKVNKKS